MSTRMTAQRLARLVAAGDTGAVRTATAADPRLLSRGVERDGQGGWTPLHLAVVERQTDIIEVLVEVGADLEATTEHGRTPLHLALEVSPDQVAHLRRLGARLDAAAAAYLDDVEVLTAELDRGAMLTDPLTGVDLLSWAARGGAASAARLLLGRGAVVDGGALHAAAARGDAALVRLLLSAGADPGRRDPETGRAPLHEAVSAGPVSGAAEVVHALLEAGADVNATTDDGASALDISRVAAARHRRSDAGRATGNDALGELLVAFGASN